MAEFSSVAISKKLGTQEPTKLFKLLYTLATYVANLFIYFIVGHTPVCMIKSRM